MPVINFVIQVSIDWVHLKNSPGDSCYINYTSIYAQISNIIVFASPISLNVLAIFASIRFVHLISQLRPTQHHVSAREKYHR